jgi:hypothetical protein
VGSEMCIRDSTESVATAVESVATSVCVFPPQDANTTKDATAKIANTFFIIIVFCLCLINLDITEESNLPTTIVIKKERFRRVVLSKGLATSIVYHQH